MSLRLKPLLLPQLVAERKRMEAGSSFEDHDDIATAYFSQNSSSTDVTSPIIPTFFSRGHSRFPSSSSLELPPGLDITFSSFSKGSTRHLPNVEEEPPNFCEPGTPPYCLSEEIIATSFSPSCDIDYEVGFFNGPDHRDLKSSAIKTPSDSAFSTLSHKIGSRFPSLSRWTAGRRPSISSPVLSEFPFDYSRPPSTRSSSVSGPRPTFASSHVDVTSPTSPSESFWSSTDSVSTSAPKTLEYDSDCCERERAVTPLLPPFLTNPPSTVDTAQSASLPSSRATSITPPSSLSFQSVSTPWTSKFPSSSIDVLAGSLRRCHQNSSHSTASLSTKPSVASFKPSISAASDASASCPPLPENDEWQDRLGHANFTILPPPYKPNSITVEALRKLRKDWETARINYTKHIVRTGENYGHTSRVYFLTEQKWAEIESQWRHVHDETQNALVAMGNMSPASPSKSLRSRSRGRTCGRTNSGSASILGRPPPDVAYADMEWQRVKESTIVSISHMLKSPQGKFPSLGDEDIVGPMARDAVMIREPSLERRASRFWKSLVDKVSLRR